MHELSMRTIIIPSRSISSYYAYTSAQMRLLQTDVRFVCLSRNFQQTVYDILQFERFAFFLGHYYTLLSLDEYKQHRFAVCATNDKDVKYDEINFSFYYPNIILVALVLNYFNLHVILYFQNLNMYNYTLIEEIVIRLYDANITNIVQIDNYG